MDNNSVCLFGVSKPALHSMYMYGPEDLKQLNIFSENPADDYRIAKRYKASYKIDIYEIRLAEKGEVFKDLCQRLFNTQNLFVMDGKSFLLKDTIPFMINFNKGCFAGSLLLPEPMASKIGEYGTEMREKWIGQCKAVGGDCLYYFPFGSPPDEVRCFGANVIVRGDKWGLPQKALELVSG